MLEYNSFRCYRKPSIIGIFESLNHRRVFKALSKSNYHQKGKKITTNRNDKLSSFYKISKENPNSSPNMQIKSLNPKKKVMEYKRKIIRTKNKIIRKSFRGALNIQARVSPQHSLQHWQSQQGSSF